SGTSLISEKFKALASNFGWYSGIIKIGNLEPGKYLLEINMSAPNYLNARKNTTLTVLERKETKISLISELKDSYTWGDTLTIEIALKEGNNPLPNKTIQFKITEIYADGSIKNKYFSSTTNKDGIAKVNYVVEEIKSLEIEVIFNGTAEFKPITLTQKNIEIHSQLEQIVITLIPFSPFIIGAIIGLSGYVIAKKSKQKKLRAEWREKTNKFFDTLNIEYFLIIHKISGLAIIQRELGQITFDGDLIGGFLQAISTFKYELKGERATLDKKESILLDYQDYKILIQDGQFIRVALILGAVPSDNLKKQLAEFIIKFEEKYREPLEKFTGDLIPFRDYMELLNKIFKLTLIKPHVVNKTPPSTKLTNFQENILSVARAMEIEEKSFFLSKLITYLVSALPRTPKEQIIANIYDLIEYGFLVPVEN
ncbi:MAG: hypothetical protein ACP6IY_21705, partial [Promethearchaeia archaeon]